MQSFAHNHRKALALWTLCVAIAIGPSLAVWLLRLAGAVGGCAPGPALCHGTALGEGLKAALALCWMITLNGVVPVVLSIVASLLAFRAYRPMLGTLTLLIMPVATLVLPLLAVHFTRYANCPVAADGMGSCEVWGASMGMAFHNAVAARDLIFNIVPYTFSFTVMGGLAGFFLTHAKPRPAGDQTSHYDHDQ